MGVARQTKIQYHRTAVRAKQYIGGFEIQVHRVLLVQCMYCTRHGSTQARDGLDIGPVLCLQPVVQRVAFDVFHHQVGHPVQVASGYKARHMAAVQHLHDLAFHLKADDVFAAVASRHARNFHRHGKAGAAQIVGIPHPVNVRHATGVDTFFQDKTIEQGARRLQLHRPISSRLAKKAGSPARRMALAAAWWS